MATSEAAVRRGTRSSSRGLAPFCAVAFAFATVMAYSAVPTPLYVLYQRRDGFGSFTVTIVFAVYALGVIASLLLAGHLSDRFGRRRLLLPALALDALSAVVFLAWPSLPGLLLGRVLCGVATGLVTATAAAYLGDLWRAARPREPTARADVVATAANIGGMGSGPLLAGVLAEWVAGPLRTPFLVAIGLLLVALLGVALAPETVAPPRTAWHYRPQRIVVPREARGRFLAACCGGLACFASFSLFSSIGPSFLSGTLHHRSHALAGAVTCAIFLAGALAQILLARLAARRQVRLGLAFVPPGLALLTVALWLPSLALFVAGGLLAGAGVGVLFKGCLGTVNAIAPAGARAEALAGFYLAAYCGTALPTLGMGLALQLLPARVALLGFAVAMTALVGAVGRLLLREPARDAALSASR